MTTDPISVKPSLEQVLNQVKSAKDVGTDTIKGLYDNWINSYDKDLRKHRYYGPFNASSAFAEHCPEKDVSILDIGSGTGLVGEQLHALGYTNIVALDISQKSLDVAEQKGVYRKLVCAEVGKEKLPFEDNEFDGMVCCGCMLPNHFRPACLREWVRVVKPGGTIALAMRKCYVEVVEGEEDLLLKDYQLEFDQVTQDLERSKRWQLVSKNIFPCYYEDSPGLAIVWKVL